MLSKNEIKFIQSLHQKKYRLEHGLFIAEGSKIVEEIISSNFIIESIAGTAEFFNKIKDIPSGIKQNIITEEELSRISCLNTPQHVLAVVKMEEDNIESLQNNGWCLALDGIQDPGNLGTIIRTADWFGIKNIVCSMDTADMYNPKVIQSTMGSFTRVNVFYTDLSAWISAQNMPVYGAVLNGENIFTLQMKEKGIILIGNEGRGIRKENIDYIKIPVTIPRLGNTESLNAAVATGIILSHLIN